MIALRMVLSLMAFGLCPSVESGISMTCANVRCSTGACEDTVTGPKCVKPGSCPVVQEGTAGICLQGCASDTSCEGDQKCCSNGCGHICTDPVTTMPAPSVEKPGTCPVLPSGTVGICIMQCTNDSGCLGTQKCCSNGCGRVCSEAVMTNTTTITTCAVIRCAPGFMCVDYRTGGRCEPMIRPGTCPNPLLSLCIEILTKCEDECTADSDCKADTTHKCCKRCGCNTCIKPVVSSGCAAVLCLVGTTCVETPTGARCVNISTKAGECPVRACPLIARLTPVTCSVDACVSDADCRGDQKCCRDCDGCGVCRDPVKPPSCDNVKCKSDEECVLREVQCIRAPCFPVPTCVLNKCLQPKEPGLCKAYFPRWYYDVNRRRCREFVYGGCGGNDNRFESRSLCKKACSNVKCPSNADLPADCEEKNECSRRAGASLPVCPQGQSCCRTPCGRKCRVPVFK